MTTAIFNGVHMTTAKKYWTTRKCDCLHSHVHSTVQQLSTELNAGCLNDTQKFM